MRLEKGKLNTATFTFRSSLLAREVSFLTIFPKNYGEFLGSVPVLYLLHGLFGRFDNWLTNTEILKYAEKYSFAVICPEGGDNWYADSSHLKNHFYESYLLQELIPAVEKQFQIGQSRRKRAIAGLSMGGYGALKFAFREPETFCFAASMSGAFHAAEIFRDGTWTELQDSVDAVFAEDRLLRDDNDLFRIVERLSETQTNRLPHIYFDCGADDEFLPINKRLSQILKQRQIRHKFKILPGGHDWNYWNRRLARILRLTELFFRRQNVRTQ